MITDDLKDTSDNCDEKQMGSSNMMYCSKVEEMVKVSFY